MIRKILIANRGEIAVRVIRACHELDIRSVAIFSEADRFALHVKKADEAYCIGAEELAGYLNPHRIVGMALETGCDAIHPGYGFLSENPGLAAACAARGLVFIGPDADTIRLMGDKTRARRMMIEAGVPVTPGSEGNVESLDLALAEAERIGYPVMLKATSGGGGRGIRRCGDPKELRQNYERVVSEATKAFGNAEVFLEKCIVRPRHIEVQVIGDHHGHVVHLYERDCSIQRRNQKLIEVAPSPQLTPAQREHVGQLAVRAAQAARYRNAGTVEFLLTASGEFYFMEMNTRIQVEHTVTEEITGLDLVQEQIRVAEGQALSFRQEDVHIQGYAMQMRINAEDPKNGFLPSYGRITRYYAPGGPGVRVDTAIYTGYEIPPYYDSMCAKIIVHGRTWPDVVARGRRALSDIGIGGVRTTIPFYREILDHPDFRTGRFDTGFIQDHPELLDYSLKSGRSEAVLAIAAAIAAHVGL
jgi:pyruvate carboxylase subunit A